MEDGMKLMEGGNGATGGSVVTLCLKRAKQTDAAETLHVSLSEISSIKPSSTPIFKNCRTDSNVLISRA